MNKKLLREFVRQIILERTAAQAPETAQLGSYAFPDKREEDDLPEEPNTQYEDELFDALQGHIVLNHYLPPDDAKTVQKFLKNGWYEDVFTPPSEDVLYRGMSLSTEELKKVLNDDIDDVKGEKPVNFVFKPRSGGGSSWTTDPEVAKNFAEMYTDDEKRWPVILIAKSADNFDSFVSGKPGSKGKGIYRLKDIARGTGFETENEVIGLGDIKVKKVSWNGPEDLRSETLAGAFEGD